MLTVRLRRMGSKKRPYFRVVVAEAETARDGSFVEVLGQYDPRTNPETFKVDRDRLAHWQKAGAQLSDTVRTLLARNKAQAGAEPAAPPALEQQPAQ